MRRFLIVKRSDLEASETNFGPLPFPESTVGQWLDDPLLRRSALEMFQAVTGYGAPFGSSYQELADQVKRKLVSAFQSGLLVAQVEAQASAAAAAAPVDTQSTGAGQAAQKAKKEDTPPKDKPEKHWFRCQLFDEDGEPMRNEPYKLKDSNGSIREKTLDENGMVYIPPSLVPGECTISFPKIHLNPRKKK
jgi:hypothetical protein